MNLSSLSKSRGVISFATKQSVAARYYSSSQKISSTNKPFIETAASLISDMKLRVASSLTSSLTSKDRDRLLESLNIRVSTDERTSINENHEKNRDKVDVSIGEAVAAAIAKESTKHKELMKKQQEEIWKRAESATLERVNQDILIQERKLALERWQRDLEEEKKAEERAAFHTNGSGKKTEILQEDSHHPVLGPVLIDLGYKRMHVVSAKTLSAIPIWEKQRAYRHERAKTMATDKMKSLDIGLPGVIALHEAQNGTLTILDGQHRVGMMTILNEKIQDSDHNLDLEQVIVEVFPQLPSSKATHANDIFTEINKAESVKLVDMPGVAKMNDRRIINDCATHLNEMYPDMFKPSQRCRSPHLNIDNLRDAIFAAGVLKRHNIKSQKALVEWVLKRNLEMKDRIEKGAPPNVSALALKKAKKFDFYLGLDLAWLYL